MTSEDLAADPWAALAAELDLWAAAGQAATLWWRDDDAAEVTPALGRLLGLGAEFGVPLALAVVPGRLAADLPARLAGDGVAVLQHGWRHVNHAGRGAGACELGDHRPLAEVGRDLGAGHRRLADAFGGRFLPVLVPPWNRISGPVQATLPALGFIGLSTFGPREPPTPGIVQVNAHCDPIKWKQGARFAGTARTLDDLAGHLAARRQGIVDPSEPTGLVTHHPDLDQQAWDFVAEVLRRTQAHPAARWLSAAAAFRP